MENDKMRTGVDLAFKLVLMNEKMPVSTIARILDFKTEYTKRMLGLLERKKLVRLNYKLFRETEVMVARKKQHEVDDMKKVKVSDWIIECPMEKKGVMFRASCQNCAHFRDIDGQMVKMTEGFEFRPEGVVCGWTEKPDAM